LNPEQALCSSTETTLTRGSCRSCGSMDLQVVLSLGQMPLANALLSGDQLGQSEERFPLNLAFCPQCALLQILETVAPEKLFRRYLYFSSFSDTVLRHSEQIVNRMVRSRGLGSGSLVIEVASNDGYLLQFYRKQAIPVLGIEPALNVAQEAEQRRGIPTLREFFGRDLGQRLRADGMQADVVHANNVLAHVPDLNGFVVGLRSALKDDGVGIVEVPYVREMIERCEFDTIYHEHLCYFSLTVLDPLFARHGLIIEDVERLLIHGGSLRLFVAPVESARRSDSVAVLLAQEAAWGVNDVDTYLRLSPSVEKVRTKLVTILHHLASQGKRLAAYGAAAKGSTLLNYCGIGKELLEFVVDRNVHKQGLLMPGVHVPIYPPSRVAEAMPDYVLLLGWNFADEILAQETLYRQRGGRFIIPIPEPHII
jgi:SAM-dependent methyltransferase